MKKEIFEIKLKELEKRYELDKKNLIVEYCIKNNPYKIGDIFTDTQGSIKIENIKYSPNKLCCVYYGIVLKKDGNPRKDGSKRSAYQINEIVKK
jgi:hypothetical protein